ncbi:MAG: site-specific integrase [Rhizobiaceae bacterium]
MKTLSPITMISREPISKGYRAGETLFTIWRKDGTLALFPTTWAAAEARTKYTPDSIATRLNHITILEIWAIYRNIDLYEVQLDGPCISIDELYDLNYFLSFKTSDLRKLLEIPKSKETHFLEDCIVRGGVQSGTILQRQIGIENYLLWLGEFGNRLIACKPNDESIAPIETRTTLLKPSVKLERNRYLTKPGSYTHFFQQHRPNVRQSRVRGHNQEREADQFGIWLSLCNPYEVWEKNAARALRNYFMLLLFAETGMRSGELGQLKFRDFKREDQLLQIVRRHNDPDDPRKRQPNAKSYDRSIRLSDAIIEVLDAWLEVRDDIGFEAGSNESEFLFVGLSRDPQHFGRPITKAAIDLVFKEASIAAGIKRIGPHPLRHKKARDIAQVIREQNLTHEEARKYLTYHFGWSANSDMINRYLGNAPNVGAHSNMKAIWVQQESLLTDKP